VHHEITTLSPPFHQPGRSHKQIALSACTADPNLISVQELVDATDYALATGTIDDTKNLARSRVWIFSGRLDTVVKQVERSISRLSLLCLSSLCSRSETNNQNKHKNEKQVPHKVRSHWRAGCGEQDTRVLPPLGPRLQHQEHHVVPIGARLGDKCAVGVCVSVSV
jgi:hypothetical protein